MEVARLADPLGELTQRRARPGVGTERGDQLVIGDRIASQELRPGRLLRAELAQAQLPSIGEAYQDARASVAQRGSLVEYLEPARRHQVDQQSERAGAVHARVLRKEQPVL